MSKFILIFIIITTSANLFANEVQLKSYNLVGKKRMFNLGKLEEKFIGTATHIMQRIEATGGDITSNPKLVIRFININKTKQNKKHTIQIGFPVKGMPSTTGSIRTFKVGNNRAIEIDYTGRIDNLFPEAMKHNNSIQENLTGEVRVVVDPFSTTRYTTKAKLQYILK